MRGKVRKRVRKSKKKRVERIRRGGRDKGVMEKGRKRDATLMKIHFTNAAA